MSNWTIKESAEAMSVKGILNYLDKDPDQNIPKVLEFLDRFDAKDAWLTQRRAAHAVLDDKDSNWYRLAKSLWTDIDDGVRKKLFENFIINTALLGYPRQEALRQQYGCNIPWAILMDPTSACNLHCTGCWAAEYGNKMNLTYEEMDSIVRQANELGTYMFLFTGGEPLVRKKDIIRLCEEHNDCVFLSFTNATLIDEAFADEMLRVKNFVPAISVEGFEQATDDRRGHGTYGAVVKAMELLRRKKLPFGISCCYTSANTEVIGSEEYFDDMIAKGAKFAWFFTYMPCGQGAVPALLATAEQREFMYHQIRKFRQTKPIFTLDFWNDGEKVSPVTISELNKKAYVHIEDWRNRPLQGGKYPYVYVDGIYLRRNWGGEYEKVKLVAKMLKAIHAQESKKAAREKAKTVVAQLREMKLKETAKKVEDGVEETLTYCDFPYEH